MKILRVSLYWFALLYIIFIPIGFYLFSFQDQVTSTLFGKLISYTSDHIFKRTLSQPKISSDSLSTYILVFLLFILSIIVTTLTSLSKVFKENKQRFFSLCKIIFCFYLTSQLFIYGLDKIFKAQFYLPEPNTLYTPIGFVSRDLLYWSTMGSSYGYNLFLGVMETIAGLLLLFRSTRVLGLLGSFILLVNIVAVNFSFDISVKIHSSFLLFLSLLLLFPCLKQLYAFFIRKKSVQLNEERQTFLLSPPVYTGVKTFILCILLFEALYPFIKTQNYSDDLASRPYLHGAYEVQNSPGDTTSLPVKRFFIHRDGYLIFQNDRDEMKDYKVFVDSITKHFLLIDYNRNQTRLRYQFRDSILSIQFFYNNQEYLLLGKPLPWKNLPLLKKGFHWAVEDVGNDEF